jgi:2-C-methyl-D-erythritol 4-phosphate cytidylyltransferase
LSVALWVVITAAGSSRRMGGGNKLLLPLLGAPVLEHTIRAFLECPGLAGIALTAPAGDEEVYKDLLVRLLGPGREALVVTGGAERQHSIATALELLCAQPYDAVAIHDGARPNFSPALLDRLVAGLEHWQGALPMVAVKDTIKRVAPDGRVLQTLDRAELFAAQTPQVFRFGAILKAHREARLQGWLGTDDASLIEWQGGTVGKVEGDYANLKVTTPEDLALLASLMMGGAAR